ncbi:MAG: glycerophosphodiester phosphodiesterase [Propionibacteriaceae bacterium]|nr:glycerophosphodiester phosphodiesterase [Propionibacteriaceae bacterium]
MRGHHIFVRASDYAFFQPRFLALAHRGGFTDPEQARQENTLVAFTRAAEMGYRYMETDVHLTCDHALVAFHDGSLDRLIGIPGTVDQVSLADLRAAGGDVVVPTMDELLEALPDARWNIDMKSDDTVEPLARAICRHHAESRVCVASFSARRLALFRHMLGRRIATSASIAGTAWNLLPVLPKLIRTDSVALQIPLVYPVAGRQVRVLTEPLVRAAHARGMKVQAWTIDDAATMERLIDQNVDGIVTNRIDVLKQVLVRRGLWQC